MDNPSFAPLGGRGQTASARNSRCCPKNPMKPPNMDQLIARLRFADDVAISVERPRGGNHDANDDDDEDEVGDEEFIWHANAPVI